MYVRGTKALRQAFPSGSSAYLPLVGPSTSSRPYNGNGAWRRPAAARTAAALTRRSLRRLVEQLPELPAEQRRHERAARRLELAPGGEQQQVSPFSGGCLLHVTDARLPAAATPSRRRSTSPATSRATASRPASVCRTTSSAFAASSTPHMPHGSRVATSGCSSTACAATGRAARTSATCWPTCSSRTRTAPTRRRESTRHTSTTS
jgi:hypothetical protein